MIADLDRRRDLPIARWEPGVWLALFVMAAVTRFHDLGARIMSHDESIHAFSSYELFTRGVYRHDPAYHGPLLYHVNAAVYAFFGDSDVTARLAPAVLGIGLVLAMWLFRPYVGRAAAACAGALAVISPTLLFYSRYIREDIYLLVGTVAWTYASFRYLEDRRARWLYALTVSMALAFISKESAAIFGAIIGSFFVLRALPHRTNPGASDREAAGDLAVLMLSLVLPFAAGPAYVLLGWNPLDRDPGTQRLIGGAAVVAVLASASLAMALWRFPSARSATGRLTRLAWLRYFALFWAIDLLFFTSLLSNPVGGAITGVAGSMGYWLTQHEVGRGSQPWFYYLMLGALYEFLPVLLGASAMVTILRRRISIARRPFLVFLVWWAVASWIGYGWAGERMPWLLAHQVLPLVLLGGWTLARLAGARPAEWLSGPTLVLALGAAVMVPLVIGLLTAPSIEGGSVEAVRATAGRWARLVLLAAVLPALAVAFTRAGRRRARRALALGLVVVLGVLTLRAGWQLAFVNYDLATEPLSYAQASPDVGRVMSIVERLRDHTDAASPLTVAYDDESTWPFVWYLRGYAGARAWGQQPEFARSAAVILAGDKNLTALQPIVAEGYDERRHTLYWWPIQDYAGLTIAGFGRQLLDSDFRAYLWRVFMRRDYGVSLDAWPLRRDVRMFVRRDLPGRQAAGPSFDGVSPEAALPPAEAVTPERIITGPFGDRPLIQPTNVAVAPDGTWLVTDAGNHRVLVLDPDGAMRLAIGGARCALTTPGTPGCGDPDGRFNEPWGVAAGPAGELYVSDTWNGRIQVFDRQGRFLRAWGAFGQDAATAAAGGVAPLYGPRGLALDGEGQVLVADTGNKRVLIFDTAGRVQGSIAGAGDTLDEPTSVVRDANGTWLVADAWNQRIVRFDDRRQRIAAWPVPGWSSRAAEDKPFVAVDGRGMVYASDPAGARVLVFTPAGRIEAVIPMPAHDGAPARPTGIAVDEARQQVVVADHAHGRLLVFALYRR